jgi:hypothetical protein
LETLENYRLISESIPGWTREDEAIELERISFSLPPNAVLVEIGAFLGSGTILLAGPRKILGTGTVHVVDPFDGSGDAFSVPIYKEILDNLGGNSLRGHFDKNIRAAGLEDWIVVHPGRAVDVASDWVIPVDFIFLDGDHSRVGAREAYQSWSPFLKHGGSIALHNSHPTNFRKDHDGHRWLVKEQIQPNGYVNIRLVGTTTFAQKM